jgi:hypothetical protein
VRSIFFIDAVVINHHAQGPNGKMRRVSGIKTKSRAGRKSPILCTLSGAKCIASSGIVRGIFQYFLRLAKCALQLAASITPTRRNRSLLARYACCLLHNNPLTYPIYFSLCTHPRPLVPVLLSPATFPGAPHTRRCGFPSLPCMGMLIDSLILPADRDPRSHDSNCAVQAGRYQRQGGGL